MRQKLAWAAERGLTPPAHAVRLAAAEAATNDAADAAGSSACCCCKPKSPPGRPACCPAPADPPADQTPPASAGPRWVIGVFALGCHGQPQAGPVAGPPAVPADASPFALEAPLRCGTVPLLSATSVVRPSTPPTPPPRSV